MCPQKMQKGFVMTKIEWCDEVWNPVWGCYNNCPYCYARKIAKRFAKKIAEKEFKHHCKKNPTKKWIPDYLNGLQNFEPTWIQSNFDKPFPKKPSIIFVNSMSDVDSWQLNWLEKVQKRIIENKKHLFVFLTKSPLEYRKIRMETMDNVMLGITITNNKQIPMIAKYALYDFLNIEPIQEIIDISALTRIPGWIILGAETGNRKGKAIPEHAWIQSIINYTRNNNIPLFMKTNLKKYWPWPLIQEYPERRNI